MSGVDEGGEGIWRCFEQLGLGEEQHVRSGVLREGQQLAHYQIQRITYLVETECRVPHGHYYSVSPRSARHPPSGGVNACKKVQASALEVSGM